MFPTWMVIIVILLICGSIAFYNRKQDQKRRRQLEIGQRDRRVRDEEFEACRAELREAMATSLHRSTQD